MTTMPDASSVALIRERPSRLRQRLRASTVSSLPPESPAGRIECRWVTGSIDSRYQFRAMVNPPHGLRRIIAVSPLFICRQLPVRPMPEVRAALAILCEAIHEEGWFVLPVPAGRDWYAHSLDRTTEAASVRGLCSRR